MMVMSLRRSQRDAMETTGTAAGDHAPGDRGNRGPPYAMPSVPSPPGVISTLGLPLLWTGLRRKGDASKAR